MAIATNPESKAKGFNLRAIPKQDNLIRVAAERRGIEAADFIIQSAGFAGRRLPGHPDKPNETLVPETDSIVRFDP